jgi:hypothetical protein
MKIIIETNAGTFAAYLTGAGDIVLYEGEDEAAVATIAPLVKRRPTLDLSTAVVTTAVRDWLESTYERLDIESVIVYLVPPGR